MPQFLKLDVYNRTAKALGEYEDLSEATCVAIESDDDDFNMNSCVASLQDSRTFAINILNMCLIIEEKKDI